MGRELPQKAEKPRPAAGLNGGRGLSTRGGRRALCVDRRFCYNKSRHFARLFCPGVLH